MISIDLAHIVPCETRKNARSAPHNLPTTKQHLTQCQSRPSYSHLDLHYAQNHTSVSARQPNTSLKRRDPAFPLDIHTHARHWRYNDPRGTCNTDAHSHDKTTTRANTHANRTRAFFASESSPRYIQPRICPNRPHTQLEHYAPRRVYRRRGQSHRQTHPKPRTPLTHTRDLTQSNPNTRSTKISAHCRKHIRLALCRKSQPTCAILAAVQPIQPHDPHQRLGTTTISIETIRPANTPNVARNDSRLLQPPHNNRACFTSNISILNARKPWFCAICLVCGGF